MLLLALCLFAPVVAQDAGAPLPEAEALLPEAEAPANRLARAVDLESPQARRRAALQLAKDASVDLDEWLAVCRDFEPVPHVWRPGLQTLRVPLSVRGEVEETELVVRPPSALAPGTLATGADAGPAPLLVVMHGAGGRGRDLAGSWADVADELGAYLLAPSEAGSNQGFTGEPRERASVLAAIRWMRRRADIDENRVYLTGYSRGGILCWDMALRYPGVFAAAAPQAGGPRMDLARGRNNMRYLDNLTATPVRAMVGSLEVPDLVWSLTMFVDRIRERQIDGVDLVVVEGVGHAFDPITGRQWPRWFGMYRRFPWPRQVIRRAARADESAHAWLSIEAFGASVDEEFTPTIRRKKGEAALDQNALRLKVIELAEQKTARAEARVMPGDDGEATTIELETDGVRRVRVLLRDDWIGSSGRVTLVQRGKRTKRKVRREASVLLTTFVERFDRTFLPVAELELKCRSK